MSYPMAPPQIRLQHAFRAGRPAPEILAEAVALVSQVCHVAFDEYLVESVLVRYAAGAGVCSSHDELCPHLLAVALSQGWAPHPVLS